MEYIGQLQTPQTIVVDIFGSDTPTELVYGVCDLLESDPSLTIWLPGNPAFLAEHLEKEGISPDHPRLRILTAPDIISNDDNPATSILRKKQSSLVVALEALQDPCVCGLVCAGNTGAVLAGSVLVTGRMEGVLTPALASYLPTEIALERYCALLDCGANVDIRPTQLLQFASLGQALICADYGISSPTVGLLNLGSEKSKGNAFVKEALPLLEEGLPSFIGNLEGRDLFSGKADVIVCDGFSGNIALKTVEGTANFLMKQNFAYLMQKAETEDQRQYAAGCMKQLAARYDFNSLKGAMLLGAKKMIVKTHGCSNRKTILNAGKQLLSIVKGGYYEKAKEFLSRC